MTLPIFETFSVKAIGALGTVHGCLDLAEGQLAKGAKGVFAGMLFTNIGGRMVGLGSRAHANYMKSILEVGIGTVGARGALRLRQGVIQKNVTEIIKGGIQTAAGLAATAFVYSLDAKIILVAQQASTLALSSAFVAKLGLQDVIKGHYQSGACKILFGLGGVATSGYYVYAAYASSLPPELTAEQTAFLDTHKEEIEEMYEKGKPIGNWQNLGSGVSKKAFTHPDLPGMLIKIPKVLESGFRGTTGEDDLRMHYENLQEIRGIAAPFDRIVLPHSHLVQTSKGVMLIEQKFDFIRYADLQQNPQEAEDQFNEFRYAAGLCDIMPTINHNAGVLSQTSPPKIGVIDFDCRSRNEAQWNWNFRNPASEFFAPDNRNQITTLGLAIGTAVAGGVTAAMNKFSLVSPKKMIDIALGSGVVAAAATAIFFDQEPMALQPALTIAATGAAIAGAAVLTAASATVVSAAKKTCSRIQSWFEVEMPDFS